MLGYGVAEDHRIPWQPMIKAYLEQTFSLDDVLFTMRGVWDDRDSNSSDEIDERLKPPQPASNAKGITRTKVLEEIIAAHATQDPEISQFREAVLGGTLLGVHEIQVWITQEQEKERDRPAVFLDAVPLPPGHDIRVGAHGGLVPDPPVSVGEEYPAGSTRVDILEYGTPDSRWVRRVPVAHGGVLARLHHLATTLAQRYYWQPGQATAFVLTGLPPILRTIDAEWQESSFQTPVGSVTALSRIILTIDPTLSPKEVRNAFQFIRQRILGAKWRDLKDKQLQLAQFALHCGDEEPWPQRMASWNTEVQSQKAEPRWCYDNLGHFKRDCQHAIEKLLAPPFFQQSERNDAETPRQS
jgi:hypothetical protein